MWLFMLCCRFCLPISSPHDTDIPRAEDIAKIFQKWKMESGITKMAVTVGLIDIHPEIGT